MRWPVTRSRKVTVAAGVTILALWLFSGDVSAQCVMCKAVAESGAKSGGAGSGINTGILYIMAIPYVLLGTLAFVIIRNHKKAKQ